MQSIFDKFSLQNLFRQFFCGFVFIASFWFFATDNPADNKLHTLLNVKGWPSVWWIALAVAACIIGTIIYHLEKNLYSYSVQALFEWIDNCCNPTQKDTSKCSRTCWRTCLGGLIIIPFLAILLILCIPYLWIFIFLLVLFIAWPYITRQVINRTQMIWLIETGSRYVLPPKNDKGDLHLSSILDKRTIAKKLATWSDFIHCAQSCCFAWIAGYWVAKCWTDKYGLADGFCDACKQPSVRVAFIILCLELLFDWHRYKHILAITKKESDASTSDSV